MKKSKIIIIAIIIVVLIIPFIPIRIVYKDGGSMAYKSLIYEIVKYHSLTDKDEYEIGTGIKLFGREIYKKTHFKIETAEGDIVGGWTRAESPIITNEFKKVFNKATEGLTDVNYTPVAYLASQVVAGTNHRVLCKAENTNSNFMPIYSILEIYEDLNGDAEITEIISSDAKAEGSDYDGGWNEVNPPVMEEKEKSEFYKACETLTGTEYTPIAHLATQVIVGTNYRILCESRSSITKKENGYVIVIVSSDMNGKSEILETYDFKKSVDEQPKQFSDNYESELEKLKSKYGIDDSYRESVNEDYNGYTEYCYTKIDKNGIANPFDSLKVTIDDNTGEVFVKKRFDNTAFLEAKVDEKTAKDKAIETHSESSIQKCVLEYYMPDYPNGDVLIAYRVEFRDGNVIYVNAISGDIAGTDQNK